MYLFCSSILPSTVIDYLFSFYSRKCHMFDCDWWSLETHSLGFKLINLRILVLLMLVVCINSMVRFGLDNVRIHQQISTAPVPNLTHFWISDRWMMTTVICDPFQWHCYQSSCQLVIGHRERDSSTLCVATLCLINCLAGSGCQPAVPTF